MYLAISLTAVLLLIATGFYFGRARALNAVDGVYGALHSLPNYYGAYVALWCGLPALLLLILWLGGQETVVESLVLAELPAQYQNLSDDETSLLITNIRNLANAGIGADNADAVVRAAAARFTALGAIADIAMVAVATALAVIGLLAARRHIAPAFRARNQVEKIVVYLLIGCSTIAVLTTVGIVLSLIFETLRFFDKVPISDFLFGIQWSPQMAIRADQVGASGAFGAIPLFTGTLLITLIAMLVAGPIGLMSAIYLAEYANARFRGVAKPLLEILAGIPTVVYGFFAALTVAPYFRGAGEALGLDVASESALAAGVVMGIMIIPFVSSLSDDVINAVPQALRDGSYGLGATRSETITRVVLPAALPGIVAAFLLAVSRAIGETMIVVMAAGLAANLTANPLEAVTTVTVQIVTLLVGDQEFDSAKTLAAFALGLVLFVVTLCLNVVALYVTRKYREKYD